MNTLTPHSPISESTQHKGSVLLVDDLPDNLLLLSELLSQLGYHIRSVTSGKMALKTLAFELPDIILLDINMPDMNGYQVCEAIKAQEEFCDIPIIFISAANEAMDKVKAFACGGVDYVTKPFYIEEVVARLESQLTIQRHRIALQKEIEKRQYIELALQQANRELHLLAHLDGLTQIANRRSFDVYLNQEWLRLARTEQSLSLLMLDVDYFKCYNDFYGHQHGDTCLRQIAQTLQKTLCRPSDLAARYGGEEFAIILPETTLIEATVIAETIRTTLQELAIPHQCSPISQQITVSIGVASLIPQLIQTCDDLIDYADKALYSAKQNGRDCCYAMMS